MYKYFEKKLVNAKFSIIDEAEIIIYRQRLIEEMNKMGATEQELNLIHTETIENSIRQNIEPEDVAWAILQ